MYDVRSCEIFEQSIYFPLGYSIESPSTSFGARTWLTLHLAPFSDISDSHVRPSVPGLLTLVVHRARRVVFTRVGNVLLIMVRYM